MNKVSFAQTDFFPTKIVCIGLNYVKHIEELNSLQPSEPVIFLKPNSSIADIIVSEYIKGFHYEGEIAFIIERHKIAGVGFGFDLTKRDVQNQLKDAGLPWERAKAFDRSAVFSKFVPLAGPISDIHMELLLNGSSVQSGGYDLMIYKPEFLLDYIEKFMTFEDGDIIMSGTPKGVGEFKPGDVFTGKIFSAKQLLLEQSWTVQNKNPVK